MKFYRPIQQVKAMSFDLDDTLYDNHPLMITAEKKLLNFIRTEYNKCANTDIRFWRSHKATALKQTPELCNDMGELRRRTLLAGFHQQGYRGAALSDATKQSFDYFYFERSHFKVDKTVCSLLEKLANHFPLVAITNGNVNLSQIGIADYFSACFKANLQQPMKPHAKMFELTSAFLDLPAHNILHIGDNMEKDVFGARSAGFSTAWFACNRDMTLNREPVYALPDIELSTLQDLLLFT